jgi:predicted CXXCH cytochrome family protein
LKRTLFITAVACLALLALSTSAYAYRQGGGLPWGATSTAGCTECHGVGDPSETTVNSGGPFRSSSGRMYVTGPHGRYTNMTDKCGACHDVHEAASSFKLLPAATVFEVCNTCHDFSYTGTGGNNGGGGPYGAIRARGAVVGARHNIMGYNNTETAPPDGSVSYEATQNVPGSDLAALATSLTCTNCHTPHGNTDMAMFLGERPRAYGTDVTNTSNKLLKDNLAGAARGTYTQYGSEWCAGCHNRRHERADINNHPVDTQTAYAAPEAAGGTTWQAYLVAEPPTFTSGRMAGWSREATNTGVGDYGWRPLCQQCHEDVRDVEAPFSITSADGTVTTDNPRWQTFPHETVSDNMTVETGDDLCLNCHMTNGLP